jgi:hypothetical protein
MNMQTICSCAVTDLEECESCARYYTCDSVALAEEILREEENVRNSRLHKQGEM